MLNKSEQNIVEQYKTNKQIEDNEVKFKSIFHLVPISIGMTCQNKFRQLNEHMEYMTGYSRKDLVGKNSRILYVGPEEFERVEREKYDQINSKGIATIETLWRRKDGTIINVLYNSTPQDKEDLDKGLIFIAQDITSWKRAPVQLKTNENKFRLFIENTMDCIWMMDLKLTFRYINPAVFNMLGYTVDEWIGSHLSDHFPSEEMQAMKRLIETELTKKTNRNGVILETSIFKKDGDLIPVEISSKIFFNSAGQPVGFQGTTRDITRRKCVEKGIKRLNENLEHQLIEQTAQLKAANKELEAFAYSVSHDLRAPLRSIDGFSKALLEDYKDILDETGRDYLRRVRENGKRMGELIEDMLKLSQTLRCEMIKESVDLSAMAHSIIEELIIQEKHREVTVKIQANIVALGDSHLLRVVLVNLLGNAWKFTAKKDTARIEFGVNKENGTSVYYVKDNGAGFDMAYSEKLFLAFQRLHSNLEFPGSGVGLATVARIIQRHGGHVWAEGKPNQGAIFFFTL
jgi:PAS domain S-box-containing protein